MNDVTRYALIDLHGKQAVMEERADGAFVSHADYKKIVGKLDESEKRCEALELLHGAAIERAGEYQSRLGTLREDLRQIILYDSSSTQGLLAREAADKLDGVVERRSTNCEECGDQPCTCVGA